MINVMEEKLLSQKERFQEKKAKLKQKISNYKKQLQAAEKGLIHTSNHGERDLKKLETEKIALSQRIRDLETFVEEIKKKHHNELVFI